MAAAAAADPEEAAMAHYLQNTIGVDRGGMRDLITDNGFDKARSLITMRNDFVHKMCTVIRKSHGGDDDDKNVSMEIENRLSKLQLFSKYCCMTSRDLDLADNNGPTLQVLEAVDTWYQLQPKDTGEDSVKPYKEGANMKLWFESISIHLRTTKGASGMPLLYVIRDEIDEAEPPEAITADMDFDDDLAYRGRLAGNFWSADNRRVFQFLQRKTHGTIAWNEIKSYQHRGNGRRAYFALRSRYKGEYVSHLLRKNAVDTLEKIRFDGKSKQFTYSVYISTMREAWEDLGADDQTSEQRKVQKLIASFQVKSLPHIGTTINANDHLRNNFDRAVTFVASELASLRIKTGVPPTRSLAALESQDTDTYAQAKENKEELLRRIKTMKADLKRARNEKSQVQKELKQAKKRRGRGSYPPKSDTFDPQNPTQSLTQKAYRNLTADQKQLMFDARKRKGTNNRQVGSFTTVTFSDKEDTKVASASTSDETKVVAAVPAAGVSPSLLKPCLKKTTLTQRAATYSAARKKDE